MIIFAIIINKLAPIAGGSGLSLVLRFDSPL